MKATDYVHCPCGKDLREQCGGAFYACFDAAEVGGGGDGYFADYLCAWVCVAGKLKIKAADRLGHRRPPINPAAIATTKRMRAAFRPTQIERQLERMR